MAIAKNRIKNSYAHTQERRSDTDPPNGGQIREAAQDRISCCDQHRPRPGGITSGDGSGQAVCGERLTTES